MTAQQQLDDAAVFYDPEPDGYDLTKDPRCLWGWGPPDCHCRFGHACFRALGHPGKCADGPPDTPCARRQRPKDWDHAGRAEANR